MSLTKLIKEQKAYGIDAGNGIYLQFESDPEFELKFESLEVIRSGIELLTVQTVGEKNSGHCLCAGRQT